MKKPIATTQFARKKESKNSNSKNASVPPANSKLVIGLGTKGHRSPFDYMKQIKK